MSKKTSRRSFLKMTAAGAVGAAGMGVFAPLSAIAEEKQTAADESGIQWDLEADIVVLGAVRLVGGTVHALNNRQLGLLMEAAERLFNLTEDCEIVGTVSPGFFQCPADRGDESPRRFGADGNQYKMKRSRGSAQRRCPRLLF